MACNCEIYECCPKCDPKAHAEEVARRQAEDFRRQQHPIRQTHTFAVLDVSPDSYDDIKARLERVGMWDVYQYQHDGEDLICFGTVALRRTI